MFYMIRASHPDEKLFRLACGGLVLLTVIAVAGVIVVFLRLTDSPAKPKTPDSPIGLVTLAPQDLTQFLNQPPLVAVSDGAVPLVQSPLTFTGSSARGAILTYALREGDTLESVATHFGLNRCTLVWSNPPDRLSLWQLGTSLTILPSDGMWYTVNASLTIEALAAQTQVDPMQILFSEFNPDLWDAAPETLLETDQQIFIPGGKGSDCITWERPVWVENNDGHPLMIGCEYSNPYRGYPTNAPMQADFRFVRGLSAGHDGVDLAAPSGTPVYAAGEGIVRYAGWHPDGLGNVIVVDHGGSHSVYGHLQTILVDCGQPIAAKQLIGGIGSTGNSNAPHLHFEVRDAGFTPTNPMIFVNKGF